MEINKTLIRKQSLDENITGERLTSPDPGVAYVRETNKVYFNRAVFDGDEPGPAYDAIV